MVSPNTFTTMRVAKYVRTRFTTLVPPLIVPTNPLKLLRMLDRPQTALFIVSFLAWTWDSFDFFCVSLNIVEIAHTYQKSIADVTWCMTVTLMLRPVGAVIFGIASDRFGRKWPFIINVICYAVIEIGTGFCTSYNQFIGVRALFGVAMGGIYGNCAATALEDAPIIARGLLSGVLQEGSTVGFLLAAAFNLAITNNQRYGWRALFWFGGGPPFLIALWRFFLPETQAFLREREARNLSLSQITNQQNSSPKSLFTLARSTLIHNWLTIIYMILLMAGFNFLSHGSQDLYPTFLGSQLRFSMGMVTTTMVVANIGALIGSTLAGYFSTLFGRRLSIIVALIIGAALIPAYVLPQDSKIMAGAFFQQFCVIGAWGIIPIYLLELAPGEFRTFVVGTSYQIGNLISAASATIEATAGQHFPLQTSREKSTEYIYDYGKVIGIFLGCNYAYLLIIVLLGPEKRNEEENINHNKLDKELKSTATEENEAASQERTVF